MKLAPWVDPGVHLPALFPSLLPRCAQLTQYAASLSEAAKANANPPSEPTLEAPVR